MTGVGLSGSPRYIYSRFGTRQVADLLQSIFVAEVIAPSRCVWLVSPWISDIAVLDNRANTFTTLEPAWARIRARLSSVLLLLVERGTTIHVATRPDEHNRDFLGQIRQLIGASGRLHIHESADLHEKGLLGDWYYLGGSMNLTYTGISVNEEALHFTTDAAIVARHQIAFRAFWGGA